MFAVMALTLVVGSWLAQALLAYALYALFLVPHGAPDVGYVPIVACRLIVLVFTLHLEIDNLTRADASVPGLVAYYAGPLVIPALVGIVLLPFR